MKLVVLSVVAAALIAEARVEAEACSCAGPDAIGFVANNGELPANAKGVVWLGVTKPKTIKVYRLDAKGKAVAVPFKIDALGPWDKTDGDVSLFLIRPSKTMKPGERYRFVTKEHNGRDDKPQTREYTISDQSFAASKDPVEITATPPQAGPETVSDGSGMCSNEVTAVASNITVALPKAWVPFSEQLMYRTIVNDKPWQPKSSMCRTLTPGRSQQATASDRVFRRCSPDAASDPGVASKDARVIIEITAPTVDEKLLVSSKPITVALACP